MCGGCKDRETHAPMRLEDAISLTPYIHSGAEYVRGDARIEKEPHDSMRLEDDISVTPYIRSGAENVRGQKNKGDEARLRHLKINAIHLDES